jgi:NADH:ubiquinone oxidoreductase subunit 6 (subunit J)
MNLPLNIFSPPPVYAQDTWTGKCVSNTDVATIQGFECLFANISQVIIYIAGIVFFIMFIVGGFRYLTSQNDPKKTASAASTLTMSIIGLIGIILSFLILKFISNFTGIDVTKFTIPSP